MTRAEAIKILKAAETDRFPYEPQKLVEAFELAIASLETDEAYQLEYERTTKNDLPKYCDRNICLKNEYNNIGCEDCEVTKSQEPTTKNDLGVDIFDKAINQSDLEEWIMETFPDWCEGDVRLIMNHMDEMPSVTPQEPKTGHWITKPHVYGVTYCSECDFELKIDNTNYCPNCGAKMEVEDGND